MEHSKLAAAEMPSPDNLTLEDYLFYTFCTLGLVTFSGCMSGLNVGMMALDPVTLKLKAQDGTPQEQRMAARLLPIISQHHWLLVSILLGNAAASETLPIVLSQVFSEVTSILISVTLILFCSEIFPQALLTGPNQLKIASRMTIIVKLVMVLFFPISFPLSKLLDKCLGKHTKESTLSMDDLKKFLELKRLQERPELPESLTYDELQIISGVADIGGEQVRDYVVPLSRVFSLSDQAVLDANCLKNICNRNFRRIPVYKGSEPSALYYAIETNCLVGVKPSCKSISQIECKKIKPLTIYSTDTLAELVVKFQVNNSKLGLCYETSSSALPRCLGVITLRDVIKVMLRMRCAKPTTQMKLPMLNYEVELIEKR